MDFALSRADSRRGTKERRSVLRYVRSERGAATQKVSCSKQNISGSSSVGRASAFQAEGRGFEPRLPLLLIVSQCSSEVERFLGKEEVMGSIPITGSKSV